MQRKLKWHCGVALAALTLVTIVSCSEQRQHPLSPESGPSQSLPFFSLTTPFNDAGACMGDDLVTADVNWVGGDPTAANCTAADTEIAIAILDSVRIDGTVIPYSPGSTITCSEGEQLTLYMGAQLQTNATSRYDLGIWIARDGGDARTGSCNQYNLIPGQGGSTQLDGNSCGDMGSASGNVTVPLGGVPAICSPDPTTGKLHVGACLSWEQNTKGACPATGNTAGLNGFRYATLPGTSSKCNCDGFDVDIEVNQIAHMEVVKSCPAGTTGTFDLQIDGATLTDNAACGGSTGKQEVSLGTNVNQNRTHTFGEIDFNTALYNSARTCTNRVGEAVRLASATGTGGSVTLQPNDDVICTITNTRKTGTITIVKNSLGGNGTFAFTSDAPGGNFSIITASNTGAQQILNVPTGSYTIAESGPPAGWVFTNLSCGAGGTPTAQSAAIVVPDNGNVTCTFTNTKQGQVVVKKVMVGGTATFAFTGTPAGSINASNGTISANVNPGEYTSTETPLTGWSLTGLTCDDGGSTTPSTTSVSTGVATFKVDPGETVTCTFTNTRDTGTITIVKNSLGDNGTFAFTSDAPGGNFSIITASNTGTQQILNVPTGSYTIAESGPPAGWVFTNLSCGAGGTPTAQSAAIVVSKNGNVTCTFTNTKQGQVIVKKVMVGGTATFAFTGTPAGSINANNGTISANVNPGEYTSTETPLTGWSLTALSCDDGTSATQSTTNLATGVATFKVDPGETVTCTFTNTKLGTMIVKKTMIGGTGTFVFTGNPSGSIAENNATITVNNVTPGAYTSTETPLAGWDLTALSCVDGTSITASSGVVGTGVATFNVDPGETVTCTFTNTKRGQMILQKNFAGTPTSFSWTGTGPAGSIATNGGTIVVNDVVPGTYTSDETPVAGYILSALTCNDGGSSTPSTVDQVNGIATYKVDPGEVVTCTFTNTELATLIITKVIGGSVSAVTSFGFSAVSGTTPSAVSTINLAGGQSNNSGKAITPGTYTVCEVNVPVALSVSATLDGDGANLVDYQPQASATNLCLQVVLSAGQTRTVVYTNSLIVGEGGTRTIGYWKNWSSCTNGNQWSKAQANDIVNLTLDGNIGATSSVYPLGLITSADPLNCLEAFYLLSKSAINGTNRPGDPIFNMVAQLLGAKLNQNAGAGQCDALNHPVTGALKVAQDLLVTIGFNGMNTWPKKGNGALTALQITSANTLNGILGSYNEGTLGGTCPSHV